MTHEEWLVARQNGIGASDAACILGRNPWKSNIQLWEEKTGRTASEDIGDKPAVKYGKEAERHLRELFALDFPQYNVSYDEFGMIANRPDEPWLFATLDGELEDTNTQESGQRMGVLEIKTTEIMRPAQWAEWNSGIPEHYYCQLLHQLLATGYSFAVLKAQIRNREYGADTPDSLRVTTRHYYMTVDDDGVQEDMTHLLQAEKEFWACVQNDRRPAALLPII
ncbi:YqaJ viral recombinase family protein [Ruminococcaceae bacterium OttesenSCG-928-I18]|nr:YqaJ viral recombinase family protein [Ruminococcaceae bacterium OttesenSCG-928-I18]